VGQELEVGQTEVVFEVMHWVKSVMTQGVQMLQGVTVVVTGPQ
jgi:hypothetical protein